MISSLLRPKRGRTAREGDRSPFSSPYSGLRSSPVATRRPPAEERRRAGADFDNDDATNRQDDIDEEDEDHVDQEDEADEDEDGHGETTPLLPIFSAVHLDSLPIYNLTHTIRLLIVPRCETTLSWDQLRSPQVSQFLVKPIQQQILTSHFSKATLYALMANCLQFKKEAQTTPGNSGASNTRASVCELLAIKLLKEFSTRELGLLPSSSGTVTPGPNWDTSQKPRTPLRAARVSCLEIAIRTQAKRFLAHPVVVRQLEAIWAGTIVFHSSADNLHRPPMKVAPNQNRGYGAAGTRGRVLQASQDQLQPAKQRDHHGPVAFAVRRSVTLYDPRDASLFKLSRLRVPRYRQFLSTLSFAVLLGLFLAVLIERSLHISALEIVFWFWSAGFMLDEIVGFNEQGFSLYILSFWNIFDLGILLLLVSYYCMRLYGILMPNMRKHHVADMAYDVLAANAVLLFPRAFSVLDHYRYFSQLLIAFRMMAVDLVAVFILIVISCSGFFVAFTLSFGSEYDAGDVAYALFQMLLGFTPAAWNNWESYNVLGKIILTLFLFITHFLIVTILITVLTNSFMAIVQNANDEHQFLFAVNAISMVKSDALFSYIAPTNVLAWLLTPLRFVLPFRDYVRINRTVIKVTHFPILFMIYAYERTILRRTALEPTELIEQRGGLEAQMKAFEAPSAGLKLFSPNQHRLREPSVATFQKDRALDEVFRRPFRNDTVRGTQKSRGRRKTSNVVNNWMQGMGPEGTASPPVEQDRSVVDRLETPNPMRSRSQLLRRRQAGRTRDFSVGSRSIASDPEQFVGEESSRLSMLHREASDLPNTSIGDLPEQTDHDGDDELITNDDDENVTLDRRTGDTQRNSSEKEAPAEDYFLQTPKASHMMSVSRNSLSFASPPDQSQIIRGSPQNKGRKLHERTVSTNTILYNPSTKPSVDPSSARTGAKTTATGSGAITPLSAGRRTPKRPPPGAARARPIMPPRSVFQSAPNIAGMLSLDPRPLQARRSSLAMDLDIGSDIGDNKVMGSGFAGAIPASLGTQYGFASGALRRQMAGGGTEDGGMMGRLMLSRMSNLEQGFREVLQEVKDWRKEGGVSAGDERQGSKTGRKAAKTGAKKAGKTKVTSVDTGAGEWMDEERGGGGEKGSSV